VSELFDEVDEDVRRDQLKKLWDQYSIYIIAGALLIIASVGGWRGYQYLEAKKAVEAGAAFDRAVELSEQNKHTEAEAAFADLAAKAPSGYRVLARLRVAAEVVSRDPQAAAKMFDEIAADRSVGTAEQDLARIRAAQLLLESTTYPGTTEDVVAPALERLSGWVLTNPQIWQTAPDIRLLNWHNRVLDESTFIKNPFAKITKFFNDPAWGGLRHDWRLTGTPNPESDLDFYSQAPWIWPQPDYYRWRGHWFVPFGMQWRVKPRLKREFHSVLAKNCFFLTRRDAGVGGTKVYQRRLIKTPPEMKRIYKKLAKEFVLEIPEGKTWETEFAGVKHSWLRRLCGGALPNEDGSIRGWWPGKTDELTTLLRGELAREQVVVWAVFKEEVERIHGILQRYGKVAYIHGDVSPMKRTAILEDFRNGKYKWLSAQPGCLRYSTDLSFLDTEIYYSSPEGFETRFQSEDRLITGDKKTPALVLDLCSEDTIDEVIQDNHIRKESRADMCRSIVQHLQKEFL